ncbi:MAG TPA: phytoene/squalene synthase family protein [Pirellulales bacterium]|nr:phytoene/squalene synthase family protein [Pirellulales bacterium]
MTSLEESYRLCQQKTRREARNFYYSFLLLPRAKRRAMCALYAFLRHTDDLGDCADSDVARRESLDAWRRSLECALEGRFDSPLLPALADTLDRYRVPAVYLHAVIDGVLMDLDRHRYETFEELSDYCYHVASAVGLACIHIWGFQGGEAALEPARKSGIALQLTNILRDLHEDVHAGRVYLPQEDLRRFDYSVDDLRNGVRDARFDALMRFEIARAEEFYRQGAELSRYLYRDGKAVFGAMTGIYHGLLDEIRRRHGDVFSRRVGLSPWRKLTIAARWMLPRPLWSGANR